MSKIHVVQYNVLSSALATPESYPQNDPSDLDPDRRWLLLLRILSEKIRHGYIICLQEISQDWAGRLQTFFSNEDYYFVTRQYGGIYNGYMGVGIAYPKKLYQMTECHMVQVGDHIPKPDNQANNNNNDIFKTSSWWSWLCSFLPGSKNVEIDQWERARRKWNTMILLQLKNIQTLEQFCVATYHMPCDFNNPTVMMLHTSTVLKLAQKLCNLLPLIFAGDMNFKPDSPYYYLVTTGKVPDNFQPQESPTCVKNFDFSLNYPMRSSYFDYRKGSEPRFTNYAFSTWSNQVFYATLDYIFYSNTNDEFNPSKVVCTKLPDMNPTDYYDTPLPTSTEPSDHLMLTAKFVLES